jgi:tetratricopeptide (TPR) repeat protein
MASSCVSLGWVIRYLGDYDKAKEWLEEGVVLFRESGDRRGIAMSLSLLGLLAVIRGHLEIGERSAREAMATARDLDDHLLARIAVFALHAALHDEGQFAEAFALMEEDLAIRHDQGMLWAESHALRTLGINARHQGAYDKAHSLVQASLSLVKQRHLRGSVHTELGRLALAMGTYDEAWDWLQQALATHEATGLRAFRDGLLATLAYVARGRGQHAQAREHLRSALRLSAESGHRNAALQSLPAMALLLLDEGAPERAVELYALASRYPYVANSRWFEDVAGREIAAAAVTLPPGIATRAQERGQSRDLWATVEELLEELGGWPPG